MRLNLSSQIVLNKVPVEFYKPKTTVEYSEISRMEKIHTDIFASMAEGASHVADKIEAGIKAAQQEGKFYVMALGAGSSLYSVYDELVRRYNEKTLSFRNVVVFNAYEYYPLQKDSSLRTMQSQREQWHEDTSYTPSWYWNTYIPTSCYTERPGYDEPVPTP
jgi:glucosamine-6-phosphate deaminase